MNSEGKCSPSNAFHLNLKLGWKVVALFSGDIADVLLCTVV